MNRSRFLRISLLLLSAALVLWLPSPRALGRVVATVDGTPVFQRQVDLALRGQVDPTRLAQLPPDQRQAALEQAEKVVLNELVGRILLVNAARREGIQISQEEIRQRMEAIIKRLAGGKPLDEFLSRNGMEKEEFFKDIEESLLIERLIDTKTRDLPPPTEEDAKRYYQANPAEFEQAENVRIRIISLDIRGLTDPLRIDTKRRRAEELRQQLLDNPLLDFAKLATEESEAFSARQGGSVGPFGRGQHAVEPEVEQAAFSQKPGDIGPVIQTRTGFHLLRVEEKNPPRTLRFEEVRAPISTYLTQMKRRDIMLRLVEEWRAVAKIERVGEAGDQAVPGPAPDEAPKPPAPPPL